MARSSNFVNKNKCLRNIQRLFRSSAIEVPRDRHGSRAVVHRAHGAAQPELRLLEAPPRSGGRLEAHLPVGDEAEQRLGEFEAKWDAEYLPIGQSWRRNWSRA